jgi:hypothetical protein
MRFFWISTDKMTVGVEVDPLGVVHSAPPIVAKFIGQPAHNLFVWMRRQPGFKWAEIAVSDDNP